MEKEHHLMSTNLVSTVTPVRSAEQSTGVTGLRRWAREDQPRWRRGPARLLVLLLDDRWPSMPPLY